MIFDGWTSWTLREPTEEPEPQPTQEQPQPPPQTDEEKPFGERTIPDQLVFILRQTLATRFPDAFEALIEALADYHDRGFPLRC